MPLKPSALGYHLFVLPQYSAHNLWQVAMFSKSGRYAGGRIDIPSERLAQLARRDMLAHHRRLAAEKAARAAKRAKSKGVNQ